MGARLPKREGGGQFGFPNSQSMASSNDVNALTRNPRLCAHNAKKPAWSNRSPGHSTAVRPENARREAAALYRGARTDAGEYAIGVRAVTGERLARAERSVELA